MARFHHGLCSNIFDRLLRNVKLDQNLVPTDSCFLAWFSDDVRDAYAKKLPTELQRKAIVNDFCRGRQYERREGQEACRFSTINASTGFSSDLQRSQ